jgi:DNA repair protein RadC
MIAQEPTMNDTRPTLITPETLQSLSQDELTAVLELAEAEDLRRIAATPVSYPTPSQRILTPERAVQLAHEGGMSTRYESLIAICLSQTHEALAVYQVYAGQHCPLPTDLDMDPLIQAATTCQAQRMIMVRYHPHPYPMPNRENVQETTRCRLLLEHVGMPMYDFLITDRPGEILSLRGEG